MLPRSQLAHQKWNPLVSKPKFLRSCVFVFTFRWALSIFLFAEYSEHQLILTSFLLLNVAWRIVSEFFSFCKSFKSISFFSNNPSFGSTKVLRKRQTDPHLSWNLPGDDNTRKPQATSNMWLDRWSAAMECLSVIVKSDRPGEGNPVKECCRL